MIRLKQTRTYTALLIMLLGTPVVVAESPWGPNPNYPNLPPPLDYQQVLNQQQLADQIRRRQHAQLAKLGKAADDSAVSSQGYLRVYADQFGRIDSAPVLDTARLWNSKSGSYSGTVKLQFESFELPGKGSLDNPRIAAIDEQLEHWQDFISEQPRPPINAQDRRQISEFYANIRDAIEGDEDVEEEGRTFLYVASDVVHAEGEAGPGTLRPVAVVISAFDEESGEAYMLHAAANPYALVERNARLDGTVGSAGQPVMDYAYRQMRRIKGVTSISTEAENNRVDLFVRSRGAVPACFDE